MISTPTPVFHRLANASSTPTVGRCFPCRPISWNVRVASAHSMSRCPACPNGASRLCPSPVPNPSRDTEKLCTRTRGAAWSPASIV